MNHFVKSLLAVSVASVLLVACSSKKDVVKVDTKPVKLMKLEQVEAGLTQIASYNVASSAKADVLRLRVQSENGIDFVVSPKGEVTAYQGKQKLWQNKVVKKASLTAGVEVAEGIVIVASEKGDIFALSQQTGEIIWTKNVASSIIAPSLILNGRVLTIANDGTVYAHSVSDGQQLWAYKLPANKFSLRGQPAPVSADGRSIVVGTTNGYIFVIDSVSGVPVIQRRVAVSDGRSEIGRLVDVDGEPVLVGALMGTTSYQGQLTVTDLNTQRIVWTEDVSSNKSPATDGEQIVVSKANGQVASYHLASGRALWQTEDLLNRRLSNPVFFNGYLVVGDLDGVLHLIQPQTGKIVGREKTKGAISHLYVDDNKLYVSTRTGTFSVWTR